ncbi:MAG: 2-polyprenyl-6-methoxyphenol hydroxylase [Phycisphaerales bacterium]|nr:2-polyprenyl-6-methoxyphenol hydroxylase [Phycisphaerales bacterium]
MATQTQAQPLVVGAGPVGLAAALFLARDGVKARIIDAAPRPSPYSKALAVNPRTLEILEPIGITAQMLALGKPIHGARFWQGKETVGELSFQGLPHKYPFMLALSQAVTVRLLESCLNDNGVHVERGVRLVGCRHEPKSVEAELKPADGPAQRLQCPWLLAADGARSTVREELAIQFRGNSFEKAWHLVDVPMATPLAEDFAHAIFLDGGGFLFLIRVVDEPEKNGSGDPIWRVIGNDPELLARLEIGKPTGPPIWSSEFRISHRINDCMRQGHVYFAGDAAHIHSPIGARGMNLGIEDAWVFSRLLKCGELSQYGRMRHEVDRRVVRRIELLSRLARGESTTSRLLRSTVLPLAARMPLARDRLFKTLTGLDHPLASYPSDQPTDVHAG